jgi:SAM-dependent methyltransferase
MRLPIHHFDLLAHRYDRLFNRPTDDPLPRLMDARRGQRILDVGGGTGRNALPLRGAGASVVVCDASLGMLRRAFERQLPGVLADVAHLPFAAGVFDRVLVVDAYHHFVEPDPETAQTLAISELLRILNRGGRLLIEEPNTNKWQTRLIAVVEAILLMGSRFVAPEILITRVVRQGGRCILREEHGFSVDLIFEKAALGGEEA